MDCLQPYNCPGSDCCSESLSPNWPPIEYFEDTNVTFRNERKHDLRNFEGEGYPDTYNTNLIEEDYQDWLNNMRTLPSGARPGQCSDKSGDSYVPCVPDMYGRQTCCVNDMCQPC